MLGQELIARIKQLPEFIDKSGKALEEEITLFFNNTKNIFGEVRLFYSDKKNQLTLLIRADKIGLHIKKYNILPEKKYSDESINKIVDQGFVYLIKSELLRNNILPWSIRSKPEFIHYFSKINEHLKNTAKPGQYFLYIEENVDKKQKGFYIFAAIKIIDNKSTSVTEIRDGFYILKLQVDIKDDVFTYNYHTHIQNAIKFFKKKLVERELLSDDIQLLPFQFSTVDSKAEDDLNKKSENLTINNNNSHSSNAILQIHKNASISVPTDINDLDMYWGVRETEEIKTIFNKAKLGNYLLCVTDFLMKENIIEKSLVLVVLTEKGIRKYRIGFTKCDNFTLYDAVDTTDICKVIEYLFNTAISKSLPETVSALTPICKPEQDQKLVAQPIKQAMLSAKPILLPSSIVKGDEYCIGGFKEAKQRAEIYSKDFKVGNYLLFKPNIESNKKSSDILQLTFFVKVNSGEMVSYVIDVIQKSNKIYSFFGQSSFKLAVAAVENDLKNIKALNPEDGLIPWTTKHTNDVADSALTFKRIKPN